uniref:Uncharacterized protein n=1 Tax=Anguilla anguilla TaxID=7936 RepID=A0A0E9P766_ANGAN
MGKVFWKVFILSVSLIKACFKVSLPASVSVF